MMRKKSFVNIGYLIVLILFACFLGLIPVVFIKLRQYIIDTAMGVGEFSYDYTLWFLTAFLGIGLLQEFVSNLKDRITEKQTILFSNKLDLQRIQKAVKVSYEITETKRFHDLLSEVSHSPENLKNYYDSIYKIVFCSVQSVSMFSVLFVVDYRVALGILLFLAIGVFLNNRYENATNGLWNKYISNMRRSNYYSSILIDRQYAAERKLFDYSEFIDKKFCDEYDVARKSNLKFGKIRLRLEAALSTVSTFYSIFVLLAMLPFLLEGNITLGIYTSIFYAVMSLMNCCKGIFEGVFELRSSKRKLKSREDFFALPEEKNNESSEFSALNSIEFRNVAFKYPGTEKYVLEDISFKLENNKHYAIVGENGCGKSTLVKLLVGLHRAEKGSIYINGIEIEKYNRENLNKMFSVVFQDFYEYPFSVKENILLHSHSYNNEIRLNETLDYVGLAPVVAAMSGGIDTKLLVLHSQGENLSGGEWQKLAVARCIMSDTKMSILDEPNSAMDPLAEAALYKSYKKILNDRCALFISHRLGSVKLADEILVIKDGKIEGKGSHNELLKNCDYYRELYETQKNMYIETKDEKREAQI